MFIIECRGMRDSAWSNWFEIWASDDGADTAAYLRKLVIGESRGREYRMTYHKREGEE